MRLCVSAAAQNTAISFLSLADTGLECSDAALLSECLIKFTALNHFDVSGNPGLGGGGVSAILASIAGMLFFCNKTLPCVGMRLNLFLLQFVSACSVVSAALNFSYFCHSQAAFL